MTEAFPVRRRVRPAVARAATASLVGVLAVGAAPAAHGATTTPASVTVAGSMDSEIGCAADWVTQCAQADMSHRPDGMWSKTVTIPVGSYAYKAAINNSWAENYGVNAAPGGATISLVIPTGGRSVSFVYDPVTHWISDDVNKLIVTAAGDFQSELGCAGDWAPDFGS